MRDGQSSSSGKLWSRLIRSQLRKVLTVRGVRMGPAAPCLLGESLWSVTSMGEDMLIEVGERGIVRIDKWQWREE